MKLPVRTRERVAFLVLHDRLTARAFLPPLLTVFAVGFVILIMMPAHHSLLAVVAAIMLGAAQVGLVAAMSVGWERACSRQSPTAK